MMEIPSSTFFTVPPHWGWLIALYFFFGGLGGGCYFIAVMIDFFGRPEDRPLARLGYLIAFPCIIISAILLTVDLYRPERFWHMLLQNNTLQPTFKYWSPMSIGSWAITIFGLFSFLGFLSALAEGGRLRWSAASRLRPPGTIGGIIAIIGGLFAFYVAGYTGVLLAVTNRPIWSDTPLLGMLFIVSAASISAALLILLADRNRWTMPGIAALHRMDTWIIALELVVMIAFLISLGSVFRAWFNAWGLLLLLGVIVLGMILPLALRWQRQWFGDLNTAASAVMVLIGGFVLRVVIVLGAEAV